MNPMMNSGLFSGSAFSGSNLASNIFGSSLPFGSAIPASFQMQFLNDQASNPALLQSGVYGSSLGSSLRTANQLQLVGSATNGLYGAPALGGLGGNSLLYQLLLSEDSESEDEDDLLKYLLQSQGGLGGGLGGLAGNPLMNQLLFGEDSESEDEDDLLKHLLQSQGGLGGLGGNPLMYQLLLGDESESEDNDLLMYLLQSQGGLGGGLGAYAGLF